MEAGMHDVAWNLAAVDGGRVPQGTYFARLSSAGRTSVVRLTVLDR
jgi:hypothetical protein